MLALKTAEKRGLIDPLEAKEAENILKSTYYGFQAAENKSENFTDILEEADKTFKDLEKEYGFIIWTNYFAGSKEDIVRRIKTDPAYFLEKSYEDICCISKDACKENKDIIQNEFLAMNVNCVFITGTSEFDGEKKQVSIIKHSLADIFEVFDGYSYIPEDIRTLYIKDGQLRVEIRHQHGVDRYTAFMYDGCDPDLVSADKVINTKHVKSLVPVLNDYFKWGLE